MREIDFDELDSAIDEFEKTLGALGRIEIISEQAGKAADSIEVLCKQLTDTTSAVLENTDEVKKTVNKFDSDFKSTASELLTIGEHIEKSNADAGNAVKESVERVSARIDAGIEESKKQVIEICESISDSAKGLSDKVVSQNEIVRGELSSADKRIENRLENISYALTKVLAFKEDIEEIKKLNANNKQLIMIGVIFASVAMIASVVGIFI